MGNFFCSTNQSKKKVSAIFLAVQLQTFIFLFNFELDWFLIFRDIVELNKVVLIGHRHIYQKNKLSEENAVQIS